MISMFAEEVSLKYLFIAFSGEGKEKALADKLKGPFFVGWSDISIVNGEVFAKGISLSKFKFILVGTIGDNFQLYSCVKAFVDAHKIDHLCYGTPPQQNNKLLQTSMMRLLKVSQINTVISQAGKITAAKLIKTLKLPVISKIIDGSQGKGIIKHDTKESLEAFLKKDPDTLFIFQEFIPNDGDYRVFFLKNTLVYAIKRVTNDKKEFRNNVSLGGTQEFVELEKEAKFIADMARQSMGFDVTGVDLIQHEKTKKWYIIEINAAPQFTGPEFKMVVDELITLIKK
jgi:hypothetical protein